MIVPAFDNFRENLRSAMDAREVSQRQLASSISTSVSYVNRVLQGSVNPPMDRCEEMAQAVGLPLVDLLEAPKDFAVPC